MIQTCGPAILLAHANRTQSFPFCLPLKANMAVLCYWQQPYEPGSIPLFPLLRHVRPEDCDWRPTSRPRWFWSNSTRKCPSTTPSWVIYMKRLTQIGDEVIPANKQRQRLAKDAEHLSHELEDMIWSTNGNKIILRCTIVFIIWTPCFRRELRLPEDVFC